MSVPDGIHPLEPTAHLPESRPTPNQRAGAHNQKVRATREPPRPHGPPQQPHSPWHRRAPLPRPTRPNGRRAAVQAALSFCHRSGARAQPHALRLRHADPQPAQGLIASRRGRATVEPPGSLRRQRLPVGRSGRCPLTASPQDLRAKAPLGRNRLAAQRPSRSSTLRPVSEDAHLSAPSPAAGATSAAFCWDRSLRRRTARSTASSPVTVPNSGGGTVRGGAPAGSSTPQRAVGVGGPPEGRARAVGHEGRDRSLRCRTARSTASGPVTVPNSGGGTVRDRAPAGSSTPQRAVGVGGPTRGRTRAAGHEGRVASHTRRAPRGTPGGTWPSPKGRRHTNSGSMTCCRSMRTAGSEDTALKPCHPPRNPPRDVCAAWSQESPNAQRQRDFLVPHSGPGVQDAACGSRHAVPL